jgi:hypothetical protein
VGGWGGATCVCARACPKCTHPTQRNTQTHQGAGHHVATGTAAAGAGAGAVVGGTVKAALADAQPSGRAWPVAVRYRPTAVSSSGVPRAPCSCAHASYSERGRTHGPSDTKDDMHAHVRLHRAHVRCMPMHVCFDCGGVCIPLAVDPGVSAAQPGHWSTTVLWRGQPADPSSVAARWHPANQASPILSAAPRAREQTWTCACMSVRLSSSLSGYKRGRTAWVTVPQTAQPPVA